VEPDNPLIAI